MARRIPLSAASKRYELIATISPEISAGEIETCRDPRCYSASILTTDDMSELNGWDGGFIAPDEVVWASRWSRCRHVYRIDRDVLPEILEQGLDGDIPCEALMRFPYPVVYVEAPLKFGARVRDGFVAWLDASAADPDVTTLRMSFIDLDDVCLQTSVQLVDGTLADADMGNSISDVMRGTLRGTGAAIDPFVDHDELARMLDREKRQRIELREAEGVAQAINCLLYVIYTEDDAEVVHRPPSGRRGDRPGRRSNPETVHVVGARMGRAIGAARIQATGASSGTGRTVAPHVRRAHWQHYWVGPRKGRTDGQHGDRLELRWVPPVYVNGDGEAVEVVHKTR